MKQHKPWCDEEWSW